MFSLVISFIIFIVCLGRLGITCVIIRVVHCWRLLINSAIPFSEFHTYYPEMMGMSEISRG